MDRETLALAVGELRVFPLPGMVLLPGANLPLHVFEPRYLALVADALAADGLICVPQIVDGHEGDQLANPVLYPYAAVGRIVSPRLLPDGHYTIVIEPIGRVRLLAERDSTAAYRVFSAELLPEGEAPEALAEIGRRLFAIVAPMLARMGPRGGQVVRGFGSLPSAQVPAALAPILMRASLSRQEYLAVDDPLRRAQLVEEALLTALAEGQSSDAAEA